MAGQADFTADEWRSMRQALTCAGVVVSLAEGGGSRWNVHRVSPVVQSRWENADRACCSRGAA